MSPEKGAIMEPLKIQCTAHPLPFYHHGDEGGLWEGEERQVKWGGAAGGGGEPQPAFLNQRGLGGGGLFQSYLLLFPLRVCYQTLPGAKARLPATLHLVP